MGRESVDSSMDWQERYESGDMPWDKGSAAPSLSQLFKESPILFLPMQEVLVPGCGLGHDVLAIAEQGCSVTGLDIAPLAVQIAGERGRDHKNADFCVRDQKWSRKTEPVAY